MSDNKLSPRGRLFVGALFVGMGVLIVLAGLDRGPFAGGRIPGVADWVPVAVGASFAAAGLAVMFQNRPAVAELFGFAVAVGLAAVGNWIAFGPGTRECVASIGGNYWGSWLAAGLQCRLVFGWGALVTDVFVLLLAVRLAANDLGETPWLKSARKGAEWLMLLVLAPILLLLVVLALLSGGGQALREKLARRFGGDRGDDPPSK